MAETQLLRSAQIVALLQEHHRAVVRWLRQDHPRGFKLGTAWRVSLEDLGSFIERRVNQPPDEKH